VYTLRGDPSRHLEASVDCGYEGLEPNEGEVWGLYDLNADQVKEKVDIAVAARDPGKCGDKSLEAKRKAAMDRWYKNFSPDVILSPKPKRPSTSADRFSLFNAEADKALSIAVVARRATSEDKGGLALPPGTGQIALGRVLVDDRVVYTRLQAIDDRHSAGREISFTALYVSNDNNRIVLLERFSHNPEPGVTYSYFSFSRIIDVTAAWKNRDSLPEEKAPVVQQPPPPDGQGPGEGGGGDEGFCGGCTDACGCGVCACALPAVLAGGCGCAVCESACSPCTSCLFGDPNETPQEQPVPPKKENPPDTAPKREKEKTPENNEGQWTSFDVHAF